MSNYENCDHESLTYRTTDTEGEPEMVYTEWNCDHCDALVSHVYESAGYSIVFPPDETDEPYEVDR